MPASYARLHPGLLARKGEAGPAAISETPLAPAKLDVRQCAAGALEESPHETGAVRQCSSVRLTPAEKRRLRAAAAALDLSHQQLIARALNDYLDRVSQSELAHCACLKRRPGG